MSGLAMAILLMSCGRAPEHGGDGTGLQQTSSALTSADVFGFENASYWSTTTSGAVLSLSSTHSQGTNSLAVKPSNGNGYTPVASVHLSTLTGVSPTLAWDVMLPSQQPNPNWFGTAQLALNCPSRGINSAFLGQVELTGKPVNVWNTVSFPLNNTQLSALLNAGYSDLTITVILNVPVPTTGVYLVDNLRFVPAPSNGCGGRPNGTTCDDGSACTQSDTCQNGTCVGRSSVVCAASDGCHLAGTCNPSTGACTNPNAPNGTSCNDGNGCTQTDTCQSGVCTGANPKVCTASDACHVAGQCVPATGACTNPKAGDGTPCNDGDACTQVDLCKAGSCVGLIGISCTPTDQCHVAGSCDPASGACSNPAAPDGTPCVADPGNTVCTLPGSCQSGTCAASSVPDTSANCVATFYQDADFKGPSTTLAIGDYTSPSQFTPPGSAVSSISIGANVGVAVRTADLPPFLRSRVAFFDTAMWNYVGDDVNDQASKIKVFPLPAGRMATFFRGNHPNIPTWFSDDMQGIAHDDNNWYLTQKDTLWKWPLSIDLALQIPNLPPSTAVPIPDVLTALGYDHFGDLDQFGGYLFVPLQGEPGVGVPPAVAVFNASDLSYRSLSLFPGADSSAGSFVAIRLQPDCATESGKVKLWTSPGSVDGTHPLLEYDVDMNVLNSGGDGFLVASPRKAYPQALDPLFDEDGVGVSLGTMQGGAFSPDGRVLYVSNGYCNTGAYISVYSIDSCGTTGDMSAVALARSSSGFGPFNFEKHDGTSCGLFGSSVCACVLESAQEPQGLDYFDVTQSPIPIPGIPDGQLHAILISNDLGSDQVWLKHYSF